MPLKRKTLTSIRRDSSIVSVALKAVNCLSPQSHPLIVLLIEVETSAGIIMRNIGCAVTSENKIVRLFFAIIRISASVTEEVVHMVKAEVNSDGTLLLLIALYSAVFPLKICETPEDDKDEKRKNHSWKRN